MKKFLLTSLAAAVLSLASLSASAATTVPGAFDVTVTLTPGCKYTSAATPTVAFGSYAALTSTSNNTGSATLAFACSRGLVITSAVIDNSGNGVIAGLNYTLTVAAPTTGTGTTAGLTTPGTADTYSYVVSGVMPFGQAGDTSTGLQTDHRTLTISY